VRVGRLSIGDYLAMLEKLQAERSRAVMGVMTERIPEIHDTLVASADRPAFERWVRNFLRPIANDLGDTPAPGESTTAARSVPMSSLCSRLTAVILSRWQSRARLSKHI
jgi:hypothetical protein